MLERILNTIATRIEAAGLHWGTTIFDGSIEAKQTTFQPADPNHNRLENLRIGIEWMFAPRVPQRMPFFGNRKITLTNPLTGEVQVEKPLEYRTRQIRIHLYMKETRPESERTGFSLGTEFRNNENRLLAAMGLTVRDDVINVAGVARGFSTEYAPTNYPTSNTLDLHGVYPFEVTYPILDANAIEPAFISRKYTLIYGEPATPARDLEPLTATATPIVLPAPSKIRIGVS
jgi:hypothetical protein